MRALSFNMQLVLVTNKEKATLYSVYDKNVCLAVYEMDKPEYLTSEQIEELRTTSFSEKA